MLLINSRPRIFQTAPLLAEKGVPEDRDSREMKREPVAKLWQNFKRGIVGALYALSQNLGGDDWLRSDLWCRTPPDNSHRNFHMKRGRPPPPLKATVLDSLYPSRSLIVSGLGDWNKCLGIRGNQIRFAWSCSFSSSDVACQSNVQMCQGSYFLSSNAISLILSEKGVFHMLLDFKTSSDEFDTNQTNY